MADRNFKPDFDPYATRNRVIRQRNIVLGLVLGFFVLLFFAITMVKMKNPRMPHKSPPAAAMAPVSGGQNSH